jgi:hypothetical protein
MGKNERMDPFLRYKNIFLDRAEKVPPYSIHKEDSMGFSLKNMAYFLNRKNCLKAFGLPETKPLLPIEGFTFNDHLFFEDVKTLKKVFYRSKKAHYLGYIDQKKLFRGVFFQNEIKNNIVPKVAIEWISEVFGYGVFARELILPKTFVGEYVGVVKKRPLFMRDNPYAMRYPTTFLKKRDYYIDGEKMGNFTRFINHSPNPNLEIESVFFPPFTRMIFTAKRKIKSNEQLLFDYGEEYWKKKSFERI